MSQCSSLFMLRQFQNFIMALKFVQVKDNLENIYIN